jgi:hypothetical protein
MDVTGDCMLSETSWSQRANNCMLSQYGEARANKKMDMNINGEPFGEWSQQVGAVREKNMIEVHFMHV